MEVDQTQQSEAALTALASLICQLNIHDKLDYSNSASLFQSLGNGINDSLNTVPHRAKPLASQLQLSKADWDGVEEVAQRMTSDYKKRAELIICRLDVMINSFFWSDRVKHLETKVGEVYEPKREMLAQWCSLGAADVLAASEDLLVLEKISSYKQRIATKSNINQFKLSNVPGDRGGRIGDIIAPIRETFSEQQRGRGGHNRGNQHGGQRGRGFNQNRGQRNNRVEDQVQLEYSGDQQGHDSHSHNQGRGNLRGGPRKRPY